MYWSYNVFFFFFSELIFTLYLLFFLPSELDNNNNNNNNNNYDNDNNIRIVLSLVRDIDTVTSTYRYINKHKFNINIITLKHSHNIFVLYKYCLFYNNILKLHFTQLLCLYYNIMYHMRVCCRQVSCAHIIIIYCIILLLYSLLTFLNNFCLSPAIF